MIENTSEIIQTTDQLPTEICPECGSDGMSEPHKEGCSYAAGTKE